MNLIEKLEKEIYNQTRNGRKDIYISIEDLEELGYRDIKEGERQYIDINILKSLMKRYEFKYNLKVRIEETKEAVEESNHRVKESKKIIETWDSISK